MGASADSDLLLLDRDLCRRFRDGERGALASVFRHYVDDVASTVRRGVVVQVDGRPVRAGGSLPESEVEALVQDTFVKAFSPSARQGYDGLRPFGAWLATIARNVLIDRARRRQHGTTAMDPMTLEAVAATAGQSVSPEAPERMEQQELDGIVVGVIATLDEPDRAIYRVRYVDGLSLKEAAKVLSMPMITLRRRDARLRQQILEEVRARGYLRHAHVRLPASV